MQTEGLGNAARCGTRVPSVGLSAFAKEFVPLAATVQPTAHVRGQALATDAAQPQPQPQSCCPAPTTAEAQGRSSGTPHQELPVSWESTSSGQYWGGQGEEQQHADAWAGDWTYSAQDGPGADVQGHTGDDDPYWADDWWDSMGQWAYPHPEQQPQSPVHAPRDGDDPLGLPAADALELLSLVFPHYSRTALQRLLSGLGGDLGAAYRELCALERQHGKEAEAEAGAGGVEAVQDVAPPVRTGPQGGVGVDGGRLGGGGGTAEFDLDMEAFPALGSSSGGMAPGSRAALTAPAQPWPSSAARGGLNSTPAWPGSSHRPATAGHAALHTSNTTTTHTGAYPGPSVRTGGSVITSAVKVTAGAAAGSSVRVTGPGPTGWSVGAGPGVAAASVPRVTTGTHVAGQYAEARRQAEMLARARNQYFQQATQAYLCGNKALARELGRRGREANEAMKAEHGKAAARIFSDRNRHLGQQPGAARTGLAPGPSPGSEGLPGGVLFVDLHGLHAAEAAAVLEAQIGQARAAGCRGLRVCTGTGKHTKGSKAPARLPAIVADTLLAHHLTFRTLEPGLLEAAL